MASIKDVPVFGMLDGLKVWSTGSVVASPYTSSVWAENGATVIHAEQTGGKDVCRGIPFAWEQEHRNELLVAVNTPTPEGKEIFLKMCEWADIWIESAKGGTYEKWGLTDEVVWEVNPKLVILHVSGYGQKGDPAYVSRASYDAAGQAFGGYIFANGFPEPMPPMKAVPYTCDYMTALNGAWMALAAYIKAQRTGKGESIDLAQFEIMTKLMLHYPATTLNTGKVIGRAGNDDPVFAGYSIYKCGDGNYIFVGAVGASPMGKAIKLLGMENDPDYTPGMPLINKNIQPEFAARFDGKLKEFCESMPAADVDHKLAEAKVPCAQIMNFEQAKDNPHYIARKTFAEWDDPTHGLMKGVCAMPNEVQCKNNPAQIWRGAPLYGADTRDVLRDFGYDEAAIDALYEKGIVK